jgi:transcriptional antiterminator RfaH
VYAQERVRQCHRAVTVAALFPGYLFIRLDRICDDWAPIRSTRGVAHIVRFGDFPLPIADKIIEKIQARLLKGPLHEPYLKFGQRVRIAEGTFSGIEAIFLTNDGEERVVLLLSILQSEQKLSFPITNVRKVD